MTEPIYAQTFCTLSELDEDLNLLGSEREARVMPTIKSASDFIAKNIGWFLPVTMTRRMNGNGEKRLYVPPLLGITSVVNDETTLASNDYMPRPEARYWPNGPYAWLDVNYSDATNLMSWACKDQGVTINGTWGLYDLTENTGATVSVLQTQSDTDVHASSGASVSPGMVIVIGSEQQYVKSTSAPVAAVTTITEAMDSEVSSITVANGALVNIGEVIRIGLEQIKIVDISGNECAVVRGWNRTQRVSHADNATVDVYRVFNVTRGVNGTTAAAHSISAEIYKQCVPADINMLCRKISGRMLKDAQGGFSGVIGDAAMGQSQYLYILPKELNEIRNSYRIIHTERV